MAVIKQRLNYKTEDGTYRTVHLETSSDIVMRPDGTSVETAITSMTATIDGKANGSHEHPEIITVIDAHIAKKDNPHGVTAAQVGAAAEEAANTPSQEDIYKAQQLLLLTEISNKLGDGNG